MKTDALRNLGNKAKKSEIRTYEKRFLASIKENDLENAGTLLAKTISFYDKAAKTNTVHKNKANRKKSQLTLLLKKASAN